MPEQSAVHWPIHPRPQSIPLRSAVEGAEPFRTATSFRDLAEALAGFRSRLGIDLVAHSAVAVAHTPTPIPEEASVQGQAGYARDYAELGLFHRDPVVAAGRSEVLPLAWRIDPRDRPLSADEACLRDLQETHRLNPHGLVLPLHGPGGFATWGLFPQDSFQAFSRRIEEVAWMATFVGLEYQRALLRLAGGGTEVIESPLSPREEEALAWSARGKPAGEIAEVMGIAQRTVVFHLNQAKAKLGARTLPQAVARAVRDGIIAV